MRILRDKLFAFKTNQVLQSLKVFILFSKRFSKFYVESHGSYLWFYLDSDHSEHPKDPDFGANLTQEDSIVLHGEDLCNGQESPERDCNQTPQPLKETKSTSTSTEDIILTGKEDKCTSTDDLEIFGLKTESAESSDTENNDDKVPECAGPEYHATSLIEGSNNACARREYPAPNLTDATKVQFLQSQLLAMRTQSVQERRKFSDTRRYWTDPVIANNLGVKELKRASSSPSLLGESAISWAAVTKVEINLLSNNIESAEGVGFRWTHYEILLLPIQTTHSA